MKKLPPPDMPVREAVLIETERNVSVHAGAGTGKTTLMVQRVVELVKSGVPLDRLAVVTFTDAAAAELRLRIRQLLREESGRGSSHCRTALEGFGSAWISTIHGFASRILREYFNLTGVDPAFTTTESHFSPAEVDREWDSWLMRLEPGKEDLEVMAGTGTSLQKSIAMGIEQRRWMDPESTGDENTVSRIMDGFMEEHGRAVEDLLEQCSDPADKLFAKALEFFRGISVLAGQVPDPDPALVDGLYRVISLGCGSGASWRDLREAKRVLGNARDRFREIAGPLCSGRLTRLTWGVAGAFASGLVRSWDADRSRLSYDDLLHTAWMSIRGDGRLTEKLAARFDHLLIDEFQDTSREQTELFLSFLEKGGKVPPGRITIVADDKQSIYGWRNADIETYNDFRKMLEKGGALSASITTNFRSTRSIIRFVNAFGPALFSARTPGEEPFSCDYVPIEARPDAPEGVPVKLIRLPSMPEEEGGSRSERSWLASLQASWFADWVRNGIESGERPEDYALLFRAGTHLQVFVDSLERAGIPYRVGSARDFLRRQEIVDLREMVRSLVYPNDTLAWAHTLRSLFFGIPDDEITEALLSGTRGYIQERNVIPLSVNSANQVLRELRAAVLSLPLGDFLMELLLRTAPLVVICATGHQVTRRLGNMQHVLELVLSESIQTPSELLELLDERLSPRKPEEPSRIPVEGGAVTLSTIHSAKGLDWKHVAVAAMPVGTRGQTDSVISYDHGHLAAFDFGTFAGQRDDVRIRSPYWPRIQEIERSRGLAESRRLMYVAVTRARESLVLLVEPRESEADYDAAVLWRSLMAAGERDPGCFEVNESEPPETQIPRTHHGGMTTAPGGTPLLLAGETLFPVEPSPAGWQNRGAELGDMVHQVMEKIDMKDPEGWFDGNREILSRLYGPDLPEVRELCMEFFRMDLPFDPAACELIGREYPYIVSTPSGPKQRYVDLLLRTPEGDLTVVDYKTDDLDQPGSEEVVAGYLETQRYYIGDIGRAFGVEARGYLAFLRHSLLMEVPPAGTPEGHY